LAEILLSDKEKEFWDIFSRLQKLCHLSDEAIEDPDVQKHLRLMANMIYFYRRDGAKKVQAAVRDRWLKSKGVAILKKKS
jgi:hypothetical protein